MTLLLHNTLTRTKQVFEPIDPHNIRMYVCGPTVYARAHIGNFRPVVVFDVLYRLLQHLYGTVTYVRNITDIDDKIIVASQAQAAPIEDITGAATAQYNEDCAALLALPTTHAPRATDHMRDMIHMIEDLIHKGHAYVAEGHVLFDVNTLAEYGALSGAQRADRIAGARVEVAPYKKNPEDFILWKPSAPEIPGWESPWGRGRPGWHIECSAMSAHFLGEMFDIHGGGIDLIFPHHENELAQSRCVHNGALQARYWLHNGHVVLESQKMSKSLGNFVTIPDLLKVAPGEAIRCALLSAHYRQPLDWTAQGLKQAWATLDRLYGALRHAGDVPPAVGDAVPSDVLTALLDDLNTPLALAALHQLAGAIHKTEDQAERTRLAQQLKNGGALLGLLQQDPTIWFQQAMAGEEDQVFSHERIEALIQERVAARAARDFARSDEIRAELLRHNIILEDGPQGTTWRRG